MRTEILQLKDLGRMPNESINDPDNIVEVIRSYDELLKRIQLPILKLVESVIRIDDGDKYIQLINACPSQEWKGVLNIRYKNYKKENMEF